jgi:hypothetical protein
MNTSSVRVLFFAGFLAGCTALSHAQVVTLRATINAAQETPATTSPATGTAIMLYDVKSNTFDLVVTINNFANTVANSHIHEAAPGVAGAVVTPLGAESVYTRSGNTLTATFHNVTYGGDKPKLLQGGAYYNVHSAQFPGGEVRGQLIAQPKRLYANINVAQEQASSTATINSNASGAAIMSYDPQANRMSLRVSLYQFNNTLANSHFHEAAAGTAGGVVTGLGGASVYTNGGGGYYTGTFDIPYTGDPVKLLTGGAYLNFHSNVYGGGEIRGQVAASDEIPGSRMINLSSRGQVGTGAQVLIQGFIVLGPEPLRILITAKGPSLSAFGVTGALSDPSLALYDSSGRLLAANNDVGTPAAGSDLASIPAVPGNPVESALLVVLSPGNYTAVVSGNNGATGIALLEVNDLRAVAPSLTVN